MVIDMYLNFEKSNPALANIFESYRGKTVDFFCNPGNAGDSLIAAGTYETFKKYGIEWNEVYNAIYTRPNTHKPKSDTFIIAGGGNLVSYYPNCREAIKAGMKKYDRIIVLPHSIRGNEPLLAGLDKRVTIFTRELPSFEHVKKNVKSEVDVYVEHDMAFFVSPVGILSTDWIQEAGNRMMRMRLKKAGTSVDDILDKTGLCLREDVEKTFDIPKGTKNLDISHLYECGVNKRDAYVGSYLMMNHAKLAGSIVTSRLHCAIGAALVDVPVVAFDNSYGKISDIFNFSMKDQNTSMRLGTPEHLAEIQSLLHSQVYKGA